jgi:hypothetical protein
LARDGSGHQPAPLRERRAKPGLCEGARQRDPFSEADGACGRDLMAKPSLLELQVPELRHPRVAALPMAVGLRVGLVERLATYRAEPGAVGTAERLRRQGQDEGVVGPAVEIEVALEDVGAAELLVVDGRLVDLASVDLELRRRVLEAADAGAGQLAVEAKPERISGGGAGDVEPRFTAAARGRVDLPAELDRVEPDLQIERASLTVGQREALEIDDSAFRIHSLRG